jgi:hypothetical protein
MYGSYYEYELDRELDYLDVQQALQQEYADKAASIKKESEF